MHYCKANDSHNYPKLQTSDSRESASKIVMRDIGGNVFTIKASDVLSRKELKTSMMPVGMANALSYEEFASLVTFLSERKR